MDDGINLIDKRDDDKGIRTWARKNYGITQSWNLIIKRTSLKRNKRNNWKS